MEPREDPRRWLEQAQEDLRWAQHLTDAGGHYLSCFLAQQVGEKALKALLYHLGEELLMSHSVEELCQKASTHVPGMRGRCSDWAYLDSFYVTTRYPNALPGSIPARVFNETAASHTLRIASEIVNFVQKEIGQ